MRRGESVAGIQMRFIGQAEGARLAEILAIAKGQSVLTVTESEDALSHGSMINFVFVDDKVRFDVALPRPSAAPSRSARGCSRWRAKCSRAPDEVARPILGAP